MLISLHPENPGARNLGQVAECLRSGGIIIYPTDTVYGLGCDIFQPKAIERISRIKQVDPKKAQFSFICSDLSHLSDYAKAIDTPTFRILRHLLPGPYTCILPASKLVPKLLKTRKNTVGIRVPDNTIAQSIVTALGHPIMSTSLPIDAYVEDYTDPEIIHDKFGHLVDLVVDGGIGGMKPSTVLDFTSGEPVLVRRGLGPWEEETSEA